MEQGPVRERGYRIVERLVGEPLLELLAFGHVACVEDRALHVRVVEQVRAERLGVHVLAVATADAELHETGMAFGVADRREELENASHVVWVDEVAEAGAFELRRVEA